jgi:hypothetical protein
MTDQFHELNQNVIIVYAMAKTVKIITVIDFLASLIFVFYSPYYLIPVGVSIIGLCGAKYYKKWVILIYSILSFISYIIKTVGLCYLKTQDNNWQSVDYFILVLSAIFELYLVSYLIRFFIKLRNLNEEERDELKTVHSQKIQYIYW